MTTCYREELGYDVTCIIQLDVTAVGYHVEIAERSRRHLPGKTGQVGISHQQ